MTRSLAIHVLLLLVGVIAEGQPAPTMIGPGTVLAYDTGYWNAPPNAGGHFISIPDRLTVIGRETPSVSSICRRDGPILVCLNTAGNVHLLDPRRLDGACILLLRTGPLPEIDPSRLCECSPKETLTHE